MVKSWRQAFVLSPKTTACSSNSGYHPPPFWHIFKAPQVSRDACLQELFFIFLPYIALFHNLFWVMFVFDDGLQAWMDPLGVYGGQLSPSISVFL